MRKIWNIVFVAFAAAAFTVACTKASELDVTKEEVPQGEQKEGHQARPMTITATIPADIATKVTFTPDVASGKPNEMALTWTGDESLNVYDAANHSKMAQFTFVDGVGDNSATFQCDDASALEGAESYDVEIIDGITVTDYNAQTQADDGDTGHLKYVAGKNGITDLKNINFDVASSILAITVQMSDADIAHDITSVDITASAATANDAKIFNDKNTLTISLNTNSTDDKILNLYATLPGGATIAAGVSLIVHLNSSNSDHTVYTRYIELASGSFAAGELNTININATQSDTHAGKTSCDGSSAEKAYLIGDKYQLLAVEGLMKAGETKYFKLIDDIDMSGESTWSPLNTPSPFNMLIDFDGNNKTISNLGGSMFYVFKGSIRNLTLYKSTVTGAQRGVLAQYIQGTGHTITNVDISNGKMGTASNNAGGLIGRINSGSSGVISATITDCDVTSTGVKGACAGGLLGSVEAKVEVSNCSYSGGTVTATTQKVGGLVGIAGENLGCTFTGCRVENTTVDASGIGADARAGGFIGHLGAGSEVKGCTVGTTTKKVEVKAGEYNTETGTPLRVGGFVGVNYGTITKDDSSNPSKAYAKITSTNAEVAQVEIGGFAGFQRGIVSYSDAVVDMSNLHGQYIGGFAGYIVGKSGVTVFVDHCTVSGSVSGDDQVGGFVGVIDKESGDGAEVTNCSASTSVSASSHVGGFAGDILYAKTLSKNESTGEVTATSKYVGGFAGRIAGSVSCDNCGHSTGSVTSTMARGSGSGETTWTFVGGFAGYIGDREEAFTSTIYQCYANNTEVKGVEPKAGNPSEAESATDCVGGFAGGIGHKTSSNNTGIVQLCKVHSGYKAGSTYVGGFAGISYAKIEKCRISGAFNLRCYGNTAGGVIGYQDGNYVKYCYSNAVIKHNSKKNIGGLIGNAKNCTVEECWSSGNIDTSDSNKETRGGMIGIYSGSITINKLIRWNHSNNATIAKNATYSNCYIKTSSDNNFTTRAVELGWSNDGSIWKYKNDGSVATLVGLD